MSVRILGYSDDLIEVEGDIEEEWPHDADRDQLVVVHTSEGTAVLEVFYDGIWRIRAVTGSDIVTVEHVCAPDHENDKDLDCYSDVVEVAGVGKWVLTNNLIQYAS